jgi:hypothetical protein
MSDGDTFDEPTMVGFAWSERDIDPAIRQLPGDLWCMRDAFSELMGWTPGTDEWLRFIEAPGPGDLDRLVDHLGLLWYDPEHGPHREPLADLLGHPGISVYAFHTMRMSHVLYQPHLRHLRPLPVQYTGIPAELFRIIVDNRQAPNMVLCRGCP